jgi:hypothetical protein
MQVGRITRCHSYAEEDRKGDHSAIVQICLLLAYNGRYLKPLLRGNQIKTKGEFQREMGLIRRRLKRKSFLSCRDLFLM